jgi:hypothetical protein
MGERKLTAEEIDEVHEHCYFRQVKYYEVQIELVDHLASLIEETWKTRPELPFDDALYLVDEQMGGDKGIFDIGYEKEKTIRSRYRKQIWQFVGSFLLFPRILLALPMVLGVYLVTYYTKNSFWIFFVLVFAFLFYTVMYAVSILPKIIRLELPKIPFLAREANKRIYTSGFVGFGFGFTCWGSQHFYHNHLYSSIFAIFVVLFYIWCYAESVYLQRKAMEYLAEQFPQFVKA